MTEPDEALLWARENRVKRLEPTPYCNEVPHIRLGVYDQQLLSEAHAYRAGAAASAERIKELEDAIQKAVARLQDYADMTVDQWAESVADGGITAWMVIRQELRTVVAGSLARALLKDPDQ